MKIKIFENGTVLELLDQCLSAGYFPATVKQIYDLKKSGRISKEYCYDTSTLYYKGDIKTAALKQLKNIRDIYENGGRLLFVDNYYYGLDGSHLNYDGCFVGVKK